MSDNSYAIEIKPASNNGYFTPAEANSYYKTKYARDGVTVHHWGDGTGAGNHDNIVNYMNNQATQGNKSVNYVLSDNKITMCVNPDNVAWCSNNGNPTTISVETQPTLTAEGYKKWGWLLDQLEQRYGKTLKLYKHSDWTATSCPGSIDLDRIRREANKWKSGEYDGKPDPTPQNNNQGGSTVVLTEEAVKTLYRKLFGREGDPGGVKNYTGKTLDFTLGDMLGSDEFRGLHVKTVEKVVEKVVEKPVEVVKEVPVGTAATPDQQLGGQLVELIRKAK